jgi:hypothetical protein
MTLRNRLCIAVLAALPLYAVAAEPDVVLVPSAKGADKYQMSFSDKHIAIEVGANTLSATAKMGTRYYRQGAGQDGAAVAEVKYEIKVLKLRDPAEKLLWKVKFEDDKVKIADNEDLKNAYVIKVKDGEDKVFNAKNTELGTVKQGADNGKIKVKDAHGKELYVVETGRMSAGYGALLLKDIPEAQRNIIVTEIFLQNH